MSTYTYQDAKADRKYAKEQAHQEEINQWLHDNPSIGRLNSGKFYHHPNGEYQEVPALAVI